MTWGYPLWEILFSVGVTAVKNKDRSRDLVVVYFRVWIVSKAVGMYVCMSVSVCVCMCMHTCMHVFVCM